ncbi:ABC transporter substrate-binding protein [Bordetella genomosp. 13]|uniref:ABC transporter substrate-binding protein n=1 Tax=Bordetella genomosp. 13 TaxID=463040 RepID=UPI0011A054D9|nr:ABC transporter substrate-binding protein [Bordetella genomosp. 13]
MANSHKRGGRPAGTRARYAARACAAALALSATGALAQISGDVVRIGFVTDLSGSLSDTDGKGGVEAVRMAIEDMGGKIDGKPVELLVADHQNRAEIAASRAREWIDRQGLDMLIGGTNSSAALAMANLANEKKIPFFVVAAGTARLTNEECNPYTVHYAYDTIAAAKVIGAQVVKLGGKSWYFLTADYAFGKSAEADTTRIVQGLGGKVIGSTRFPMATPDFSSYLLQAQSSDAQILALATSGDDTINAIKAAYEFGVTKTKKLAGMLMYLNEVNTLTLEQAQGMYVSEGWYWDQSDESREWSARFQKRTHRMPSSLQAADWSVAYQYLKAVKAVGSDDPAKVMAHLRGARIEDMYARNGYLRPDGRMVHDMYLYQVKSPQESKKPWDYYKIVQTVPGDEAFATRAESACKLWKE